MLQVLQNFQKSTIKQARLDPNPCSDGLTKNTTSTAKEHLHMMATQTGGHVQRLGLYAMAHVRVKKYKKLNKLESDPPLQAT